jgi:hypothetical protein
MNLVAGWGDQGKERATGARLANGVRVMGRAILAISGSAAAKLPRPFAAIGGALAAFWQELTRDAVRPYRPEQHYMRGPGPAWRAKHGDRPAR